MVRPASVDSNGLKKGAWSEEEDNKLRAYIQRYGHWNWRLLPKYAGLARCGKSCRLRWVNYLKPGIKKGNFSEDEKDLIVKLHAQLGNKWSAISAYLPGRTDNEIKNFWNTRRKKSGLNENPTTNNVNNGCSASSRDQALGKEKTSETTICITTRNESPSTSENPKPLSENTHPSDLNADFQVDFWQDTAYTQNDYFPPLPEEEFSYSQLHYSELSSSNSCYPNRIEVDDLSALFCDYATQPLQEDFWSESLVSNTSNSVSENCCNNWTQEVGGFYDPFLQFYDPF